jgi:hypothetical protein
MTAAEKSERRHQRRQQQHERKPSRVHETRQTRKRKQDRRNGHQTHDEHAMELSRRVERKPKDSRDHQGSEKMNARAAAQAGPVLGQLHQQSARRLDGNENASSVLKRTARTDRNGASEEQTAARDSRRTWQYCCLETAHGTGNTTNANDDVEVTEEIDALKIDARNEHTPRESSDTCRCSKPYQNTSFACHSPFAKACGDLAERDDQRDRERKRERRRRQARVESRSP